MKLILTPAMRAITLAFACALASSPALAEKGGNGKGHGNDGESHGNKHERSEPVRIERGHDRVVEVERARERPAVVARAADPAWRFSPEHRTHVSHYYDEQFRAGNCPPGLAKKHNGCMPPGQAKKMGWNVGQPLPSTVVTYPVPQPLLTQLGTPPAGYRYVRVGNDILLLSPGSAAVVDVIRNFGRG